MKETLKKIVEEKVGEHHTKNRYPMATCVYCCILNARLRFNNGMTDIESWNTTKTRNHIKHRTYAYACVVRVNQPLSVHCFILVIPAFGIRAFNCRHSSFLQHPVLYTGHFTLHPFSALVSFGSDDINESLSRRANSPVHGQIAGTVVSCLFLAAVLIECWKSWVPYAMKSKFTVRKQFG